VVYNGHITNKLEFLPVQVF